MLYTAKCFWPGVADAELRLAAARAADPTAVEKRAVFRGALHLVGDEVVLCLFDAPSRELVKQASERAGMPCERVIDSVWVEP
jgi:hypothetical protein